MICFEDVTVLAEAATGVKPLLQGVNLNLAEQKIAVIGANGSGKSTLIRLINGLLEPSTGQVTLHFDGQTLDSVKDARLVRQQVGFLFTDPRAQIVMPTVIEDVELSLKKSYRNRSERLAHAQKTLERFGLQGLENQSVHTLSGGQTQLLALAAVLATAPRVLVADEPTTLLDLKNGRIIGDLLMSLDQQVILATHDLDLAARCDRALVIDAGRVVFDGDPGDAIAHYRASI